MHIGLFSLVSSYYFFLYPMIKLENEYTRSTVDERFFSSAVIEKLTVFCQ